MKKTDIIVESKSLFCVKKKISYSGAISHITQRASGKEPLFLEDADYLYMLHILKKESKEFNFDVLCFCLMPNHLHILIKQNEDNLSKSMKNLFETYAMYFNKKYQRKGHVFGGVFRQVLCLDDSYMLTASLYIHLNPYKAKLIDAPWEYRWSSCSLYIKLLIKSFVNCHFILGILNSDRRKSQQEYKKLLDGTAHIKTKNIFEDSHALMRFRNTVVKFVLNIIERNRQSKICKHLLDEERSFKAVDELRQKGKLRNIQDVKARKFLIQQLLARGFSIAEISERFQLNRRSVYRILCHKIG